MGTPAKKNSILPVEPKLEFSIYDYTIWVYENKIVVTLKVDDEEKEVIRYNC